MFEVSNVEPKITRVYDDYKYNDYGYVWRKVFVVDDFYKNPDEVRDLALSSEPKSEKKYTGALVGKRVVEESKDLITNLKPVFNKLCQHEQWRNLEWDENHFNERWDDMKFMVNVTSDKDVKSNEGHVFHKDNTKYKWAALVYLNKDGEVGGGTDFYRWKEDEPSNAFKEHTPEHTCEMKYNRMVLYEARHTHGAILEEGKIKDIPRLTQVFFM
jgi:hypothetical protein